MNRLRLVHGWVVAGGQRPPRARHLVDGGFVAHADIELTATGQVDVYAPLPARRTPDQDPTQPRANDAPGVRAWRERMQTEAAKLVYKLRAQPVEWANAGLGQHGLHQFRVRGRPKARTVLVARYYPSCSFLINAPMVTANNAARYNGAWPGMGSSAEADVCRAQNDAGGIGGGANAHLIVEFSGDDAGAQGRHAHAGAFQLGRQELTEGVDEGIGGGVDGALGRLRRDGVG